MASRDPFLSSMLAQPAARRVAAAAAVLVLLWGAIAWAIALP
ncbi:hypothetical protein [Hansschlegelia beijingensis]|uniref:Uncharacterized protein n=1 Tax=Hansschlegelia beijingensis TaxID=1133344 RepID=A0A7W6CXU1_9HYPH|nr:hypothetical protein [Hansschlegelia beijingensis]MBB3973103.1 hypothetical protein [Hansschlegelia beijingensis]